MAEGKRKDVVPHLLNAVLQRGTRMGKMDRRQSQILGVIVLALILLCLACFRYYLKLG